MNIPSFSEYPQNSLPSGYITLISEGNVLECLQNQADELLTRYESLQDPEQGNYRYAEGKWSLKEVLGHMIDTERVFAYRALCIARGEKQSLPGFDQDEYMQYVPFGDMTLASLVKIYRLTRQSNIALFETFTEADQTRMGVCSNYPLSARALVTMIAGHERHHLNVLAERYGLV
ncbi:DinB family protein [Siphonobacter sp. SORGH_AS_1065]|uniref:DinB family protein n=1 Tax=Siphonobacter sp. SORGH_AS_1065 TaxID=3041795 RepID=UPI00278A35A4|nr:DinB family protein [Siphonobacter sp. SORGH_AS_1065]MDQ1088183.1 putative damage-inducible protein DinB [Siphonobacter sp. SORGH_AS_1065]